jgi:hypothetical protein
VFPLHPDDDDDLAGLVKTTLGPFRLKRRVGGPSRGKVADVEVQPSPDRQDDR